MAINDLLNDLSAAVAETRQKLLSVEEQIDTVKAERDRVAVTPPHSDDIVAAFMRGLDAASASFEARLAWNLNDANARDPKAAVAVEKGKAQLLTVLQERPAEGLNWSPLSSLFPPSVLGERQSPVDLAALTYFLRDAITAQIPALVDKLCPSAKGGMKQADRKRRLIELDAQLASLTSQRDDLKNTLAAARDAVKPSL